MPELRARVTDLADLLPPERERALEARLAAFEGETTHQLAVVTVPSLEGEPIESFALRVAAQWKLGDDRRDNGMLLVVAKEDRAARVEVGYGLEGVVPDAVAKRVLEDTMFPRFRAGDFAGGISAACEALIRAARAEVFPAEPRPLPSRSPAPRFDPIALLVMTVMVASFVSMPFRRRARALGALLGGGVAAALVWILAASALFAGLAFVIGTWFGFVGPMAGAGRGGRLRRMPGGFGGGGFGAGGGGGFRGGGGGFGGGGASGRW